jgi:hypothetical protein
MSNRPFIIRTLTEDIADINGCVLHKNISLIVSQRHSEDFQYRETCTVYIDNGKDSLSDFDKHIVFKKKLYENSI